MGKETQHEPEKARGQERSTQEDPWLRCTSCGYAVAQERARIDVDGKHVHAFVNPQGIEYTIRCFAEAPGCSGAGDESTFWTWFPGYAWRMALCARCAAHLGWSFRSNTSAFWGLIVGRVG
jgi:hypothetical protein